jgi:uncharacterized protein
MPTIDSDAHVLESSRTWDYMEQGDRAWRPQIVTASDAESGEIAYWLVDGRLIPNSNVGKEVPEASREMRDVELRLRHMEELDISVQVIYPTIFIFPVTRRPEVELALCRSYNRWIANVCDKAPDRLRWVVVPPLLTMASALQELHFGKDNGACGVFMRGLEGEKRLSNPYFFPLYEEASRLGLPICVHSSNNSITVHDYFLDESGFAKFKLAVVGAFHSILFDGIPDRFPRLRIGFIEVSSQWVPYAIHDLRRRFQRPRIRANRSIKALETDVLRANRIFVACQTDDDLPYVVRYAGEDNLLIGSDYGHNDTSTEIKALQNLRGSGALSPEVIQKILYDNARDFYGI